MNSYTVFLLLSNWYLNPERGFEPGTLGMPYISWEILHSALDRSATTAGYLTIYNKLFFKLIIELWTTSEVDNISFCCWPLKWTTSNEQVSIIFRPLFSVIPAVGLFLRLDSNMDWPTLNNAFIKHHRNIKEIQNIWISSNSKI